MKTLIVFAGVNGAGKTTLYQLHKPAMQLPRINLDEIVRSIGSWRNEKDVMTAGLIAVRKIREYLEQGISFNQETTLCGKSVLKNIQFAKDRGYRIEMYYVGVESPEIAKKRVRQRVADGGHGVPDEDIERRYDESLEKLKEVLPLCDRVVIYDNTDKFTQVADFESGKWVTSYPEIPSWVERLELFQ